MIDKHSNTAPSQPAASGAKLMATTLMVGAALVLVAFASFTVFYNQSANRLRTEEINHYMDTVSRTAAWGAANWLNRRIALAEELAYSIEEADADADIAAHLKSPIYQSDFTWVYFGAAKDGAYFVAPEDPDIPPEYEPRLRPWYKAAVRSGRTTLTEPYVDILTGVETITVATPIYRNGVLFGVVGADFSTDSLSAVLQEADLGGLGYLYLASASGKILAHPNRKMVAQDIAQEFDGAAPILSNHIETFQIDGDAKIAKFEKINALADIDWRLGISIHKRNAFAALNKFRLSALIAAIGAALLLVSVLGATIHRLLVRPLLRARRAADAANVAKSEFLASMSHEIRTPMNGVLGMAAVLAGSGLTERQRELVSVLTSSGNALMTVINDVLDFAKLEAGKLRLTPQGFDFRKTTYDVAAMMQARALEKQLEMIVRYAPHMPDAVIGDDARLRQVLGNLIGNAVKFTEHGYIFVEVDGSVDENTAHFEISVRDTGIGISKEQLPRMFEKFEQADGSHTRQYGGAGLGLAICKDIIEMMDGEISAASTPGEGSTFKIRLSLPLDRSAPAPRARDNSFEHAAVLAIDDNETTRKVLSELAEYWRVPMTIVGDASAAFDALDAAHEDGAPFKIALIDDHMPYEDGVTLAKRLQARPSAEGVRVVILSSLHNISGGEQPNGAQIAACLNKPVHAEQMLDVLATQIAQSAGEDAAAALKGATAELQWESDDAAEQATLQATQTNAGAQASSPQHENAQQTASRKVRKDASVRYGAECCGDNRPTILIAEDNPVNQLVIRNFVPRNTYHVEIVDNGANAVDAFKDLKPAAVFMDLSMPVMDGFEATARIRQFEAQHDLPRTPIIAATAHVLDQDRERCYEAGMDDFLTKPISKPALEEILTLWIDDRLQRAG